MAMQVPPTQPEFCTSGIGHMLEEVVRQLPDRPDVLVVNGTGLDHPRHAGMALHLGYLLDLPTGGVTHRPICADG